MKPRLRLINRLLQAVEPHDKGIVEALLTGELSRQTFGRSLGSQPANAYAIEVAPRRSVILHEDRISPAQIRSQMIGILALLECPHLHGESSCERRGAGYQLDSNRGYSGSDHIDGVSSRERQVDQASRHEGAAVDNSNLSVLAII